MDAPTDLHALDVATRISRGEDGLLRGATHAAYANMVGPYGGVIAATVLRAALEHPSRIGDPLALTVNYCAPVADGGFVVDAKPARTNRSTQHWTVAVTQGGEAVATASAVFAIRRQTWSATDARMPSAPPAASVRRSPPFPLAAWTRNYDMRFVHGPLPDFDDPPADPDSASLVWVRDDPPRVLDFLSLAAICDVFYPRIMRRRPRRVPAGTVSFTSYFHADGAQLAAQGTRAVLAAARASRFGLGYHDQSAEIWSDDGALLATSHQVVYFRE